MGAIWRAEEIALLFQPTLDFTYNTVPYFAASSVEQNIIIITACLPSLGPLLARARHPSSTTTYNSSTTDSARGQSSEDADVRHNLAKALGMPMPLAMGNKVIITAGGAHHASTSEEHILRVRERGHTIKTTTQTQFKVERMGGGADDDMEQLHPGTSERFKV
ncbi:hypothetical protein LTR62_008201 [Meristemomyces frigidus]|uniref:Uncharacterized protein n=1 Tax=Meristemomyces frigidus TaxID=1508187 RepID=A0AAN7TI93_9PEZI|nr:hypothetical protein LTR62_008201 [Meristemomyces frigidus]